MLYTENRSVGQPETDWSTDGEAFVHMAVNKDPAIVTIGGTIDNLSDGQWWYYTGLDNAPTEVTEGNGGAAFDFAGGVAPFRASPPGEHNPTVESARYPSLGFDERAVIVAFSGNDNVFNPQGNLGLEQFVYIMPREHTGGTFVDGDRPPESEIISINMTGLPVILDKSVQARVV